MNLTMGDLMGGEGGAGSTAREFFGFCTPTSSSRFLEMDVHQSSFQLHRQSKSSSNSREFEFMGVSRSACVSPARSLHEELLIAPADELFYNGRLLPLYISERQNLKQQIQKEEKDLRAELRKHHHRDQCHDSLQTSRDGSKDSGCSSSRVSSVSSEESVFSSSFSQLKQSDPAPASGKRWKMKHFFSRELKPPAGSVLKKCKNEDSKRHGLAKAKQLWRKFLNPSSQKGQPLPSRGSKGSIESLFKSKFFKRPPPVQSVGGSSPALSTSEDKSSLVQSAIEYCKQTCQVSSQTDRMSSSTSSSSSESSQPDPMSSSSSSAQLQDDNTSSNSSE